MKPLKIAIVGATGTVGQSIFESLKNEHHCYRYNSQNIDDIFYEKEPFDIMFYAAVPAVKWKANEEPEEDRKIVQHHLKQFNEINARQKALISTIDVRNENSGAYGRNRKELEDAIKQYDNTFIFRLPALVGKHVKKNQWFDSLHSLPNTMNDKMMSTINKVVDELYKKSDEQSQIIRKNNQQVEYLPNKQFWIDNNLGMHLAHNPYSVLKWLDIDGLGNDLLDLIKIKTENCSNLKFVELCSSVDYSKALLSIEQMYFSATQQQFPKVSKEFYQQIGLQPIRHDLDDDKYDGVVLLKKTNFNPRGE